MAVLESQLRIRAVDETKAAFDAIQAHIKSLSATVGSVNRAIGGTGAVVSSVGRTAGAVSRNAALAERGRGGLGASLAGAAAGVGGIYGAGLAARAAVAAVASRQHEQARMAVAGETPEEIRAAELETAKLAAEFPNVSQPDLLHMLRNARSIVGSYEEAAKIAEPLVKLRTLAQLQRPGEDVSEDFDQLIKALEIKGVTQNPKQFQEYMEGIAKAINVFGDTLRPYQYYEMFKYGRQATSGLSERFILGTAPTLAQELGGQGFGAAVSAFNRLLVSGVGKKGSFEELARLGLIDQNAVANIPGTGEGQGLKAGHTVSGWQLAQSDPNEWVKQYLLPAFDKAGIKDKDQVLKEVGLLFQSQRASQLVDLLATQQARIGKDYRLIANAPGLSAAGQAIVQDPGLSWQGVKNSVDALVGVLGESVRAADWLTARAKEISRFTEDLTKESQAESKGEPSPAIEDTNRRLNRMIYGEDTAESGLDVFKRKFGWLFDFGLNDRGRADLSLAAAGYRGLDLEREMAREHARAVAASAPAFRGASDWESRAGSLTFPVVAPPASQAVVVPQQASQAGPQEVNVSGQAQVDHTIHVEVTLDPALRAKIDQLTNTTEFTVPLIGGGTGRMDSDAAPHRVGGIGSM